MRMIFIITLAFGIAIFAGALIVTIVTIATRPATASNSEGDGPKVGHLKQGLVPYEVDLRVTDEKFVPGMEVKDSPAFNAFVEKKKPMINALCEGFPVCELEKLSEGSVIMEFQLKSEEEPRRKVEQQLKKAGINNTEIGRVLRQEVGPCERLRPCQHGGTCSDLGYSSYECCCPSGWAGKNCDEEALTPKPYGPQLECINDLKGDIQGLNYFGTQSTTTSGRRCQAWSAQYPHTHPYNGELGLEHNYCRNRGHGVKGLYRPWCYTEDPHKEWEYCDNIPLCSNLDETLPKPPADHGCFTRADKGASYQGYVDFTESGKLCSSWYRNGYHYISGNNCRNPEATRNKPWCWTRDGAIEDCDIPVCSLPPPEDTHNRCKVDKVITSCDSKIVLIGDCYYKFNLNNVCVFTIEAVSRRVYNIYTASVTKELHWQGAHGKHKFSDKRCNVVFEVTGFGELTIRQPLCGWCAMTTSKSLKDGVDANVKSCPIPPEQS